MEVEKFNPTRAEVQKAKDESLVLLEKEITDINSFNEIDTGRKKLKKMRTTIDAFGKKSRDSYVKKAKEIKKQADDLIDEIKPTEDKLAAKQEEYKQKQIIETRKKFLPKRMEQFAEIKCDITEDELLKLDDDEVSKLYVEKKGEYLEHIETEARLKKEAEERKLAEEREALRKEKEELERQKHIEEEKKKAAEEARLQAIKDAEVEKERVKREAEEVKRKAEQEKQDAVNAEKEKAAQKEREQLEEIEREKQIRAEAEAKLKEEERLTKKREDYQKFLSDNGYTEETKDQFKIEKTEIHMILYKLVNSFKYKD